MRNELLASIRHHSIAIGMMGGMILLCLGGTAASGGIVTLNSQTRFVEVTTEGSPLQLTPESQRQDAPDFGPFSATVTTENFQQPLPGILQRITQTSSMTLSANGALIESESDIHGSISFNPLPARSFFDVHFTLSEAAPFQLRYVGLYGDARFIGSSGTIVNGLFTGPGAPGVLEPADIHTYNRGDVLKFSGTLQPGAFDVQADLNAIANAGFVNIELTIGSGQSVPLPPAVWAILAMLPLVGMALRRFGARPVWPQKSPQM